MGKLWEAFWAYVLKEGRVVKGAPVAFSLSLAALAFLISFTEYGAFSWGYSRVIDLKDSTIQNLGSRITNLSGDNSDLRDRLGLPAVVPHDENSAYQQGKVVGVVEGAVVNVLSNSVSMEKMTVKSGYLPVQDVYFREWQLHLISSKTQATEAEPIYTELKWSIDGRYPPITAR